mmetsp:Transcript_24147/g.37230  ORF Transcript_24147/g.37230 Transcript_24147/m.37230 type:complete len:225 (+) Transcript_24147:1-675(+)
MGGFNRKHFSAFDLMKLGHHLCQSILELSRDIPGLPHAHKVPSCVPSVQPQKKRPPLIATKTETSVGCGDVRSDKKFVVQPHPGSYFGTNFNACKHTKKCVVLRKTSAAPQLSHQKSNERYISSKQTLFDDNRIEVQDDFGFSVPSSKQRVNEDHKCFSPSFVLGAKSKVNNMCSSKNFFCSSVSSRNQELRRRKAPSVYDFQVVEFEQKRGRIAKVLDQLGTR